MKLQCSTNALREAVQLLYPVCPTRTTLPILANLHVRGESGSIHLTGTDLDISVRTSIAAEVGKAGETTIPVRFFLDALRRINSETITLSVDTNNVMALRGGEKVHCNLRGMAAGDFPKIAKIEGSETVSLSAKELVKMIRQTSYAVSRDESRYVLNGVCFNFGESFEVVATDGRRLAKCAHTGIKREDTKQIIVPTKSIGIMMQMMGGEGDVQLRYTANQLEVSKGATTLVTRLVDGHYPNYSQVIPKSCPNSVTLNKKRFYDAVGLAVVVTEKTKQSSVVRVAIEKGTLTVSANTAEIGEVQDVLEVKYTGDPVDIAFNPSFLSDVCQNVDEEDITIEFGSGTSPVVLRAGGTFLCVIMPMRV